MSASAPSFREDFLKRLREKLLERRTARAHTSPDGDGLDSIAATHEGTEVVNVPLNQRGSTLVGEEPQELQSSKQVAAEAEGAIDDAVAGEGNLATVVVENNVFEGALDEGVAIEFNGDVAEGLGVVVHGNRVFRGDDPTLPEAAGESNLGDAA